LIAGGDGFIDYAVNQQVPDPQATKGGTNVQPFHLTDSSRESA
jgi:hypothetical protein